MAPVVIVGAGQAGLQTAESLRSEGWEGEIVLLGDESHAPYHRPPLSKAYLLGESSVEQVTMRTPEVMARKRIELRTGRRVAAVDRAARRLQFVGGGELAYGKLVFATGSRARRLAGHGAACGDGIYTLRTLDDCTALQPALAAARRVAVVGGGFIGLEFAAVARKLGKAVCLVHGRSRLMGKAVSPAVSEWFRQLHVARGVEVRLDVGQPALEAGPGRAPAVVLADGTRIDADLVVVGIGALANDELAAAAGLPVDNGIVVDACGRTADPDVFAAGDCAVADLPDGRRRRLESVHNAVEQGKAVAAAIVGREKPFLAAPWFWSDQYEFKLQMAGSPAGHDREVIRGDPAGGSFSVFLYGGGRLLAVDSVNRPQDHMVARKLLDRGLSPDPAQAADASFALNGLLT